MNHYITPPLHPSRRLLWHTYFPPQMPASLGSLSRLSQAQLSLSRLYSTHLIKIHVITCVRIYLTYLCTGRLPPRLLSSRVRTLFICVALETIESAAHRRCSRKSYWKNEGIDKGMKLMPALQSWLYQSLRMVFREYHLTLWYTWIYITTKIITHVITTKSSFRIHIFHDIHQPEKDNLTLHASKKIPSQFHRLLFTSRALVKIMWLVVVYTY